MVRTFAGPENPQGKHLNPLPTLFPSGSKACLTAQKLTARPESGRKLSPPQVSRRAFLSASVRLALGCVFPTLAGSTHGQSLLLKTETFDANPGWDGRNNRATDPAPRQIVQNFGFSSSSANAGGAAGEIGGFITTAPK